MDVVPRIIEHIVHELAHGLNQAPESINPDLHFADMGADSLILAEALQEVNRRYRVSLPVGEMYENVNTISKVAQYIHANGDWQSVFGNAAPVPAPAPVAPPPRTAEVVPLHEPEPLPSSTDGNRTDWAGAAVDKQSIEYIVRHQLELMERQLNLLARGKSAVSTAAARVAQTPPPPPARTAAANGYERAPVELAANKPGNGAAAPPSQPVAVAGPAAANAPPDRFSAFSIRLENDTRKSDAEKVRHIGELTARFNRKTPQSKQLAQAYRHVLADNRVSAGFRPLLKELVYPILAEQARGSRVIDVDGNEYVDFTMGFGVHLFGHSPDFVTDSIRQQMDRGIPVGPQSPVAGRVAELICELTGHQRAVFCNSGTEATMTAVRLARAKADRSKIVVFRNSYHGTFDGFLARSSASGGSRPASLGTPESMVQDTIVLDYCEQSALDYIEQHHQDLAAVMVEPVQSRAPSLQPGEFLKKLRRVTQEKGIALIFDEVISGFRCAAGGAQEYFGVKADICSYGKIIGGGMPIGVVAGAAAYMDGIDGGWWQYNDGSYPTASTIFFAGTFSKHPLTMAASIAVLEHIKAADKQFYKTLNDKTRDLSERLNAVFDEEGVDVAVEYFSSLFRFSSKGSLDLFFYHLMDQGFYIWEGRNCFGSTAHSAEDLTRLVEAVRKICRELTPCGLLPLKEGATSRAAAAAAAPTEHHPISDAQQRFYELERSSSPDGSIACNICFGFRFEKPVDVERLAEATKTVLKGQEALWYRFDLEQGTQRRMPPHESGGVERISIAGLATPARIDGLLDEEQRKPLDIASGRNIRANIYSFEDGTALLSLCMHHLACDGWGLNVLLQRIAGRYAGTASAAAGSDIQFSEWIGHENRYRQGEQYLEDKQFWRDAMEKIVAYQKNNAYSSVQHGHQIGARNGGRVSLALEDHVTERLLAKARSDGTTPFTWLLAGFQVFLNRVYRNRLPVIGIPFANRTSKLQQIVGSCVNLMPLLPFHGSEVSFEPALAYSKQAMNDLFAHSKFPYHEMCAFYQELSSQSRATPVTVTFNVEPITEMPRFGDGAPTLLAPVNSRIEFDLMFNIFLLKSGVRIELDYNTDLFAEDMIYGWLYLFAKIIENQSTAQVGLNKAPVGNGAAGLSQLVA
jgi:glutamate-1-semialdehyde aminotransferase/acyl carrier protein